MDHAVSLARRRGPAVLITSVVVALVALSLRPVGTEPAWLVVVGRVAPLTLLAAGVAQGLTGRTVGSVSATFAALSWAGVTWGVASVNRSDTLVGVGFLVAPFLVPWLLLQIAELPTRWRPGHAASLVAVAFVGIGLGGVIRALVYQPLLDLECGPFCGHSPVLLTSQMGLAAFLEAAAMWTAIVVCASVGLGVLVGLLRRTLAGSRTNAAAILIIAAMVALTSAAIVSLTRGGASRSFDIAVVLALQSAACVAVATAALLVTFDRLAVRRNLAEVARLLGAQDDPLTVEAILGGTVGDPDLRVGYWTDEIGYVDSSGLPIGDTDTGRQRTELTSRGRPVAILIHDNDSLPADLLVEHFGPQARLAIQNESLQFQLRRRVEELRASRRRIVDVADAERRSLERDLHDGAQQLLLALSFELRRGERAAASSGDMASSALFSGARSTASMILDELRILAHGIHPGILTGAGLEEALISYAATVSPSPQLTFDLSDDRLPENTESAVYAIVTGLIKAAPGASVSIGSDRDAVRVFVDGMDGAPEHVLDRLDAAGGSSGPGEHGLELVLPCA